MCLASCRTGVSLLLWLSSSLITQHCQKLTCQQHTAVTHPFTSLRAVRGAQGTHKHAFAYKSWVKAVASTFNKDAGTAGTQSTIFKHTAVKAKKNQKQNSTPYNSNKTATTHSVVASLVIWHHCTCMVRHVRTRVITPWPLQFPPTLFHFFLQVRLSACHLSLCWCHAFIWLLTFWSAVAFAPVSAYSIESNWSHAYIMPFTCLSYLNFNNLLSQRFCP